MQGAIPGVTAPEPTSNSVPASDENNNEALEDSE